MRNVPLTTIKAAQACDLDAVNCILKHFEGYMLNRCSMRYRDMNGQYHSYIDEDLRYHAEIGLYAAIFKFRCREPRKIS